MMECAVKSNGYVHVSLRKPGEKQVKRHVHRLVAFAFVPGFAAGLEVNHLDGDKTNNHASNLAWCTHFENMRHANESGLFDSYRKRAA